MADPNSTGYDARWTTDGPNILRPQTMSRIQAALSSGWICGLHRFMGGGRNGDVIAFATYVDFVRHVDAARSGDLFILWSVSELNTQGLALAGRRFSTPANDGGLIQPQEMESVVRYLTAHHEVLAVASNGAGPLEAIVTDVDFVDDIVAMSVRANVRGGEMWIFPFDTIDQDRYYLVRAKRPDASGQVPLGGAY